MILLNYRDPSPIYEQVRHRFEELILSGVLKADEKLPSVRSLAVELSINPNTIQRAYNELEAAGYIYSVRGKGNFTADISHLLPERRRAFFEKVDSLFQEGEKIGIGGEEMTAHVKEFYSSRIPNQERKDVSSR